MEDWGMWGWAILAAVIAGQLGVIAHLLKELKEQGRKIERLLMFTTQEVTLLRGKVGPDPIDPTANPQDSLAHASLKDAMLKHLRE